MRWSPSSPRTSPSAPGCDDPYPRMAGSLPFGGYGRLPGCGWSLRGGLSPQHPLDIRLHLLQLLTPVGPAVRAGRREVEHPVGAAGRDVVVPEGFVGPQREPFEELRGHQVAAVGTRVEIRRGAGAAVDPDPGVVGRQLRHVDHRVVALPRRVGGRTPHALSVVTTGVVHR